VEDLKMNNLDLFYSKAKNIKLIASDIDGTLTDGTVYISESGEMTKRFSFKDVMGITRLRKNGYIFALVTGETSKIVDVFARRLKIEDVYQGTRNKRRCLEELAKKYNLEQDNICFIGDDVNDIPALELAGLPVVVNNANYKVKRLEGVFITDASGGKGAVREVSDHIISEEVPLWEFGEI
jgi:3-deoxy-D-manno-octulosonate 8-phosphate phosphatase (KDO 8-P phosphatase)